MNHTLQKSVIFAVVIGFVSACATVPPTMDPAEFVAAADKALAEPSPVFAERQLAELLARTDLAPEQRANVYLQRARMRQQAGIDKPGALIDLSEAEALLPEESNGLDAVVEGARAAITVEIANHEERLAGLQTLSDWFDDKVALGGLEEGAQRYQRTGLSPTQAQVSLMRDAGYICVGGTAGAGGEPVYRFEDPPSHVADLVWCPTPPNS